MFKFNFSNESEDTAATDNTEFKNKWLSCEQVLPGSGDETILKDIFNNCEVNTVGCTGTSPKYFSTIDILNILRTNDECETTRSFSILNADQSHSDLETAVYEGGLKIWECTYDLMNYINDTDLPLKNKNILDLGCGTGLIGILGLLKDASCIFQDYNTEVLQYITIPNVQVNDDKYIDKSKFYSGDWQSFVDLFTKENKEEKFDYIFTSETIYNTENHSKLHNVFQETLKKDGEIYLAAKSYYFGVGGAHNQGNKLEVKCTR